MDKVVSLADRRRAQEEVVVDGRGRADAFDSFLATEGLDVLNAYRAIDDWRVRIAALTHLRSLAGQDPT